MNPRSQPDDLALLLYLANALPALRRVSETAARLTEHSIVELAVAIACGRDPEGSAFDLYRYLGHAVRDVEAIAPTSADALRAALCRLLPADLADGLVDMAPLGRA
ncbi:hypothetical protein GCM10011390_48210 [Aureimonas endophytica]|uniref:Uncharacterized protein n=1 Tax=Aureimonas endophytica TaxID=2027858 RepID=A0A917ECV2_9HYPH|nr:hypothetical protein [Aureimonas endophytica]GGE23143.1 hypothetical protein GCM10011390_48210 [Aureimonas endophytica]